MQTKHILAIVALLCAVGKGRGKESPEDGMFLDECKARHPDATKMMVTLSWFNSCSAWCTGGDPDGNFREFIRKGDEWTCTAFFVDSRDRYQCWKGSCVLASNYKQCVEKAPDNDLQYASRNGCNVSCTGKETVFVTKTEGTTCFLPDPSLRPGKCDRKGECVAYHDFVAAPEGVPHVANRTVAKSVCENLFPDAEDLVISSGNLFFDDGGMCKFQCSSRTPKWLLQYKTFENGYACGEDEQWTCLNGRCTDPSHISICKKKLRGAVKELDINECTLNCTGETGIKRIEYLPTGSACLGNNGMGMMSGTCDRYAKCQID